MRAQKRKVLVACALLNQTTKQVSQIGGQPILDFHRTRTRGHQRIGERPPARHRQHPYPPSPPPEKRGTTEQRRCRTSPSTSNVSTASWLHLPAVSRATTTNLQRSPATSSWYFRSLSRRPRCKTAPLVCAASAQAMPWAVNRLRKVTSIANCAQWKSAGQHFNRPFIHSGDSHVHSCHAVSCCNERKHLPHDTRELKQRSAHCRRPEPP